MKKLMICIFAIAMALVSPFLVSGMIFDKNITVAEAKSVETLTSVGLTGEYYLADNLNLTTDHNPIGSDGNPFTGVFDGQGHTITLTECSFIQSKYQGIFGYAENATIRNIKIVCENVSIDLGFNGDINEYFVGMLLGRGVNVTIENCEVEGTISSSEKNVQSKLTLGGLIGSLEGQSSIKNAGTYVNLNLGLDLSNNTYTNKIGSMAGLVTDSSSMRFCVGYSDIALTNNSTAVSTTVYQGGLVGSVNGALVTIFNCAVTTDFANDFNYGDTVYVGGLLGGIVNLSKGNIASCGFHYTINSVEGTSFYGNSSEVVYNYNDNNQKDDIINISPAYMMAEKFFTKDDYNDCGLDWYGLEDYFNFSSVWIVANDQAKLQQFQHFEIKLVSRLADPTPLDAIYNTLEDLTEYVDTDDDYSYGDYAKFRVGYSDAEEFQGFYEINDILKDGVSIGFADFLTKTEPDEGNFKVTKRYSLDGNYELYTREDTENSTIEFEFKVKAEYSTRGTYSFRTSEIPYFAYILAEEGGEVKSASSSISRPALEPRQLTKNYEWNIKAVPAYQYAFTTWTLWEEITKDVYDANSENSSYYKHATLNPITQKEETTYWHSIQDTLEEKTEILTAMKSADFKVVFGSDPFLNNFMLKANFEKTVYAFNVKDIDVEKINKIVIVNKLGDVTVFNENSTNTDFVNLDQNETIVINIYLKPGYAINPATLPEELKVEYLGKSEYDTAGQRGNVFKFAVATSNFKDFVNKNNQLSLELVIEESNDAKTGGMPLWLIITIAGGGALLIAIIIIVIVVKVRRGGGRGGKSKSGKKDSSMSDYDYNQMFR